MVLVGRAARKLLDDLSSERDVRHAPVVLGVAVGRDGADDHAQEVWVLDHPGPKRFRNRRRRHVAVPRADSADDEDVPMDRTQPSDHEGDDVDVVFDDHHLFDADADRAQFAADEVRVRLLHFAVHELVADHKHRRGVHVHFSQRRRVARAGVYVGALDARRTLLALILQHPRRPILAGGRVGVRGVERSEEGALPLLSPCLFAHRLLALQVPLPGQLLPVHSHVVRVVGCDTKRFKVACTGLLQRIPRLCSDGLPQS
mmetsp:Transcript_20264/g.48247  ORF Transcript_20264/g.48247 Transcript_20264/m.48247 type:complete len:258 (+) Transcript_20264:610-1383(+)